MNANEIETQWIKDFLLPKLIENGSLKGQPKCDEFALDDISITFITSAEAFMLTNCFKVLMTYKCRNEKFSENILIKKTPKISKADYDAINFETLFRNEIIAYTEILPKLSEAESSIIWENHPRYYYSHIKDDEACIVLSDFTTDGWRMSKNKVDLSLEHLILAAKHIGKFHGICYDIKHNNPEFFNKIVNSLGESRYATEPIGDWEIVMRIAGQRSINSAKKYYNQISEDFLQKLNEDLKKIFHQGKRILKPIEPQAIICHGDYLRNNVAFRYDDSKVDECDLATDIMMFDYQTLRYSSPMCDLTSFISLSSGKETRQKHFHEIFKAYCDSLKQTYEKRTSEKIPDFMNYDNMLKEYVRILPYSLGIASTFLMSLYDPLMESAEEFLNQEHTEEEIFNDVYTRGGETVDKELAALVYDLYDFSKKLNINIFE